MGTAVYVGSVCRVCGNPPIKSDEEYLFFPVVNYPNLMILRFITRFPIISPVTSTQFSVLILRHTRAPYLPTERAPSPPRVRAPPWPPRGPSIRPRPSRTRGSFPRPSVTGRFSRAREAAAGARGRGGRAKAKTSRRSWLCSFSGTSSSRRCSSSSYSRPRPREEPTKTLTPSTCSGSSCRRSRFYFWSETSRGKFYIFATSSDYSWDWVSVHVCIFGVC